MSEPVSCPRCGDAFKFSSVSELRVHLITRHTYETLLLLSQARVRSSRARSFLPLSGPTIAQTQSSSLGTELLGDPLPLEGRDLASSSAPVQLLFSPQSGLSALVLPKMRLTEALLSVDIGLEERLGLGLGLGCKIARTLAEVEERVNLRVNRLKTQLNKKETELRKRHQLEERLRNEKLELDVRVAYLSRQVSAATEMIEKLNNDLEVKEKELSKRQQEMVDIEWFLRDLAEREAKAKVKLQVFIESLLDRADRAERHLLMLTSHKHYSPVHRCGHSPVFTGGSLDDIITSRCQESLGNRRSYSVSGSCRLEDHLYQPYSCSQSGRMRTLSLGSQGWDRALMFDPHRFSSDWDQAQADTTRFIEGDWGRTWSNSHRHHSSEEEEEEDEEQTCLWRSDQRRLVFARSETPASDVLLPHSPAPSCFHGDRIAVGAESLRLRAWLFCVFPYLDVRSLLTAAEVCSDWRTVARHPAVWTRLCLENVRISTEFLVTLSQWCTQTQSIVLRNLKPRSRRAHETLENYRRNIRGSVEPGLEFLLRSAGGSVQCLSVSGCDHILTERAAWLASCYCRNLSSLTYRSASDPLGQEVLWALGAGCRNIRSLQVAPAHPCQQPARFGNRCLQTIGRCWPRLRLLGVGGASCGPQGLAAVARACPELQWLELERITDLGLQVATELCEAGLKQLQTLVLTHTPVSGQAVLHFHQKCSCLRALLLEVSSSDYFENPDSEEAQDLFREILSTLEVLQKRPGLCDVLQVRSEPSRTRSRPKRD